MPAQPQGSSEVADHIRRGSPRAFKALRVFGGGAAGVEVSWRAATKRRTAFIARLHLTHPITRHCSAPRINSLPWGQGFSECARRPGSVDGGRSMRASRQSTRGRLTPRRAGRVVVEASAGGWRRDSTEIVVTKNVLPLVPLLLNERWADGFARSRVPFDDPNPSWFRAPHLGQDR